MQRDSNPLKNLTSLGNKLFSKDTCNIDNYITNLCKQSIIDSQEVNIVEIEKLHNWSIPRMRTNTIYSQGIFQLNQNYAIKTEEQIISSNQNLKNLQLFYQQIVNHHKKQFNYIPIGLVQIVIRPFFRLSLDIPVFACLRDTRAIQFSNSILSMIDSNPTNGPFYFNCYPNFSMNINYPSILTRLTLNTKTNNMNFVEHAQTIVIVYIIYYKVMTTQLNPRAICQSVKGETLLLEYNPQVLKPMFPKNLQGTRSLKAEIGN